MTLPTAPSRSMSQSAFDAATDAFVAALPSFETDMIALATAMTLNSVSDISTSSVLIGLGAKTFTVSANKSFVGGMYLVIADAAAPSTNSMVVQVTSYSGTTLVVNSISVTGSGTKASWVLSLTASSVADIATQIHTATNKTTPIGADEVGIWDSVSGLLNRVSFTNLLNFFAAKAGSASQAFSTSTLNVNNLQTLAAGADIASAATVDLTAATGNTVNITGTTAISAFTMNDGQHMTFIAVGALPLTYHATTCKIAGGQSVTMYAGQVGKVFKKGTVITVIPQDPVAVFGGMQLTSILTNIAATTYTKMVCSAGNAGNVGMTFTDANDEITITSGGAYDVTIAWRYSSSTDNTDGTVVLYKNGALASAGYQPVATNPAANRAAVCVTTYTLPLSAGDVLALYAWSSAAANSFSASGNTYISIAKRGAYP